MKIAASFFYAARFLFAKKKNGTSGAKKSLFGAMLCIGISLIPLVTVLVISNGMVEGITERMIGLSSSHLQVFFRHDMVSTLDELNEAKELRQSMPSYNSSEEEIRILNGRELLLLQGTKDELARQSVRYGTIFFR